MLLDCKYVACGLHSELWEVDRLSIWMNDWRTLPYFKKDIQYKNLRLRISFCPLSPIKGSPKTTAIWQKSRNGHDQENSHYTIQYITEYGRSLCDSEYPTLLKSRDQFVWCSKGRKRQNTELYKMFLKLQNCPDHLNAFRFSKFPKCRRNSCIHKFK